MGKNPAFQFYPGDWERDLKEHPLEVQGFWMMVLCQLWWSEEKGKVCKPLSKWSLILGVNYRMTRRLMGYLKDKRIADITVLPNGEYLVISRRMVKDEKLKEIRKMAGCLGGNPAFEKGKPNPYYLHNQKDNQNQSYPHKQKITPSSSSSSSNNIKGNNTTLQVPSPPVDNLPKPQEPNDNDAFLEAYSKKLTALQNRLLSKYGQQFNFYKMIRNNLKANKDAILHCLERLLQYEAGAPEVYFQEILNRESGNFNERAFQSKVAQDKNIFSEILDKLKNLQRT